MIDKHLHTYKYLVNDYSSWCWVPVPPVLGQISKVSPGAAIPVGESRETAIHT